MNGITNLDLSIDENNLAGEWQGQASLMLDYGIQLADAMQEEAESKARLDVVRARLDKGIRALPENFDIPKPTETAVANAIILQPEYEAAVDEHNQARHGVMMVRAAVDALAHRKSALQGMTETFMRQWHADPKNREQPAELRNGAETGTGRIRRRRTRRPKGTEE